MVPKLAQSNTNTLFLDMTKKLFASYDFYIFWLPEIVQLIKMSEKKWNMPTSLFKLINSYVTIVLFLDMWLKKKVFHDINSLFFGTETR